MIRNQMLRVISFLFCVLVLPGGLCAENQTESEAPRALLHSDFARVARVRDVAHENETNLAGLANGDLTDIVHIPTKGSTVVDLVYSFQNQTVSPETLTLHHLSRHTDQSPASVEILVSTLSEHTGFQSLRVCHCDPKKKKQEFSFVPQAAKWVMLRLVPQTNRDTISVAEIDLQGIDGPPKTRYAFDDSPTAAFEVLAKLKTMVKTNVTDDETALFADARDGKLDDWTFAEAALIASGASDARQRKPLLQKLAQLERAARRATIGGNSFSKGKRLLRFLHDGPMSGGYVSKQTDLTVLLNTAKYNCVSSATVYNVLGRRLGLDVRGIEVPDHAFSILYDGSRHADVEVTTAQGFDPSRDPITAEKFQQQTGFRYIADRHPEQRREISNIGLISIIYYNHGVFLSDDKRYGDALVRYFCALSLDPEFDSAVKNVLATLANWSVFLSNDSQFSSALNVVNAGIELAPKDATLVNNRLAIWQERVEDAMNKGETDRAIALLRKADTQVPNGNFRSRQSWVFLRPAENLVKASHWEEALATAKSGMSKVDKDAQQELLQWRQGLFLRWSNSLLKNEAYEQAFSVLQRGLKIWPEDPHLANNASYVAQQWAKDLKETQGPKEAEQVLTHLLEDHINRESIRDVARSFAIRLVNELRDQGQFSDAIAAATRCAKFIPKDADSLKQNIFDRWAKKHVDQDEWPQALDIYETGLQEMPGDDHLTQNLQATWYQWSRSHMDAKRWADAADVCLRATERFPDEGFADNIHYIAQEWLRSDETNRGPEVVDQSAGNLLDRFGEDKDIVGIVQRHYARVSGELASKEKFDEALSVIARGQTVCNRFEQEDILNGARSVFDQWARLHSTKGEWKRATDIYAQGLVQYPMDEHLMKNASVTWDRWARTHMDKKEWGPAIKVYQLGLKLLPESRLLKRNLEYCQHQQLKEI